MRYTFVLSLLLTLALTLGAQGEISKGLVAHWPMDEGKGDLIKDASGNGNDGKIENATWVDGKFGKGLKFEANSKVTVPHSDSLSPKKAFTISLWIKPFKFPQVENRTLFKPNQYNLDLHKGRGRVEVNIKGRYYGAANPDEISTGEWHHLVGTYDTSTRILRFYVDGKLKAEKKDVPAGDVNVDPKHPLIIGSTGWAPSVIAILDEIRIYNRALSEKEVLELFTVGPAPVSAKQLLTVTWGEVKSGR